MIKKLCKKIAVVSMVAVASIVMFTGCVKKEEPVKRNQIAVEEDVTGGDGQKIKEKEVVVGDGQTQAPTQGQVSKDPLEAGWTIGKFGYFEPPMEQRKPVIIGGEVVKGGYRYTIHDEKYGDIDIQFNETNGKRSIFKAGQSAEGRLAVFGASVKKSTSEMLQDLREGDAIADAWGR